MDQDSKIHINQQTRLYDLLKAKNATSELLNEGWWAKTSNISETTYNELKLLLRQNRVSECEMLIKNL